MAVISILVSIHDAEGKYVFASTSHEKLGYHPRDLVGKSGFTMVVEADKTYLLDYPEKAKNRMYDMDYVKRINQLFLHQVPGGDVRLGLCCAQGAG